MLLGNLTFDIWFSLRQCRHNVPTYKNNSYRILIHCAHIAFILYHLPSTYLLRFGSANGTGENAVPYHRAASNVCFCLLSFTHTGTATGNHYSKWGKRFPASKLLCIHNIDRYLTYARLCVCSHKKPLNSFLDD